MNARCSNTQNQQAPIPRPISRTLRTTAGAAIAAEFDFRQKGQAELDIELTTTSGSLKLSRGGAGLGIDGRISINKVSRASLRLYERFAALCEAGESEVDWRPFQVSSRPTVSRATSPAT